MTEPLLRVSFDLRYDDGSLHPWRIWELADSEEEAAANIRQHYGTKFNPPLRFRQVRVENRETGERVGGGGPWQR